MAYSVLTKVTNGSYRGQKFYLYKDEDEKLITLNQSEANTLIEILNDYPKVFTETVLIPREDEEIKLLNDFWGQDGRPLDFEFENVFEDCEELQEKLEDNFSDRIVGIDRIETVRQTYED